ncbi:hypothetical protein [Amycolatopsis speibonae]|uniref:Uncharacterized protein n=1 Tax=Amycolatopsis speibonae TaxID=1450224 RepID=A0ABV7PBR6_9PSEU
MTTDLLILNVSGELDTHTAPALQRDLTQLFDLDLRVPVYPLPADALRELS